MQGDRSVDGAVIVRRRLPSAAPGSRRGQLTQSKIVLVRSTSPAVAILKRAAAAIRRSGRCELHATAGAIPYAMQLALTIRDGQALGFPVELSIHTCTVAALDEVVPPLERLEEAPFTVEKLLPKTIVKISSLKMSHLK